MFVEVIEDSVLLPDGNKLETVGYGLLLNIQGVETPVLVKELTNVQVDKENMSEAKYLYVTYKGQDYKFELPNPDSRDWAILEEVFHPE